MYVIINALSKQIIFATKKQTTSLPAQRSIKRPRRHKNRTHADVSKTHDHSTTAIISWWHGVSGPILKCNVDEFSQDEKKQVELDEDHIPIAKPAHTWTG